MGDGTVTLRAPVSKTPVIVAIAAIVVIVAMGLVAITMSTHGPAPRDVVNALDNRLPDLIEDVRGSVVHIRKVGEHQGSGCLISPDGILFTAKHVSDSKPGDYEVTLDDGRVFEVKPGYVLEDRENDITFLMLDLAGAEPNLPYATLATEDVLRVGQHVVIMGSPLGSDNFNSVSVGILSALDRDLYNRRGWGREQRFDWHVMLQSTSPAYPGNSGGPIFSMQGEVIGVLVAGQDPCLNFSVPISRFVDTIGAVRTHFALCRFNVVEETFDVTYEMQRLVNAIDELK